MSDVSDENDSPELLQVLAEWIAASDRPETTHRAYRIAFDHLARLGITKLAQVTRENVREFMRRRTQIERRTAVTVNRDLAALLSVMGDLERRDLFPTDRLMEIRRLRFKVRGRRLRRVPFLTVEAVKTLAQSARMIAPRVELPILVCAYSGLRIGELARLHTDDLKLGEKPLLVVRSKPELGPIGRIKNGHERSVSLCTFLKELLLERVKEPGWVFPAVDEGFGRPPATPWLSPQNLRRLIKFARIHARIPDGSFVNLRHTRASWWAAAGLPRVKIAEWLGDTQETVEKYYIGLDEGYDPDCERMPA